MSAGVSRAPRTRIAEAKDRFTIPILWRMFNLPGKPAKSCRSPFREDRSPSFSVSEDGLRWIDFANGERGDGIDFLAKIKGISSAEAFIEFREMSEGTVAESVSNRRQTKPEPRREPLKLDGIEACTNGDLWEIAKLRRIHIEGLRLALARKLLFSYEDPYQGPCWLITDDARRNAIYRRMDGKRFHFREATEDRKEGPKSKTVKGSEANWPIGIAQASAFPAIALCEGGPDFLSAFALAYAGAVESLVEPVCMSGAACRIHEDALPMFRGKRVRIFGHADETGQNAVQKWAEQLRSVEAEIDAFDFSGLLKCDGSPAKDLNDLLLVDRAASDCAPEIVRGVMDFALERRDS
jgi:hypothetical protein